MGAGKGQGRQGLLGDSPAVSETEEFQQERSPLAEDMEVVAMADLGKLKQAYTAVAAACGADGEMAKSLLGQIRDLEAKKTASILPHVQLQRTQKRLQLLSWKADQVSVGPCSR